MRMGTHRLSSPFGTSRAIGNALRSPGMGHTSSGDAVRHSRLPQSVRQRTVAGHSGIGIGARRTYADVRLQKRVRKPRLQWGMNGPPAQHDRPHCRFLPRAQEWPDRGLAPSQPHDVSRVPWYTVPTGKSINASWTWCTRLGWSPALRRRTTIESAAKQIWEEPTGNTLELRL
jgi:hypothetical protein